MRILHYVPQYYPVEYGGMERHTRELSIQLAEMGHSVSVYTTDALELENFRCKKYLKELTSNDSGVRVFRFHVVNSVFLRTAIKYLRMICDKGRRTGALRPDSLLFSDALSYSTSVPALWLTLPRAKDFDVVNGTMCGFGELFFLERNCQKNKVPFVFTPRSHTLDPDFSRTFSVWLKIAKNADAVIALTKFEKDYYIRNGVDESRVFVTGIGIFPEKYETSDAVSFKIQHGIPTHHKVVAQVGRMVAYKGAEVIIRSMKKVWKEAPETHLVVLGTSTRYTEELRRITEKEKRILLLPNASDKTKADMLSASDLLVSTSEYESFGGVFLEAWAAGKPIISTRTPVSECVIKEGKDGLFYNASDTNGLANKITFLLKDENAAKEMGKKGKEKTLANYTWEKIAQLTLNVYESMRK
jgi:glycosyltransferase involved in cell wall biosynthesis